MWYMLTRPKIIAFVLGLAGIAIILGVWGWDKYSTPASTIPMQNQESPTLPLPISTTSPPEETGEIDDKEYERALFNAVLEIIRDSIPATWNTEIIDNKISRSYIGGVDYNIPSISTCPDETLGVGIGFERLPLEEKRTQASAFFYVNEGEQLSENPPAFLWFSQVVPPDTKYGSTMTFGVIAVDDDHTLMFLMRSQCEPAVSQLRDAMIKIRNRLVSKGEFLDSVVPESSVGPKGILTDRVIVRFHDEVPRSRIDELNAELNTTVINFNSTRNYFVLQLPETITLEEAQHFYESKSEVDFTAFDTAVHEE